MPTIKTSDAYYAYLTKYCFCILCWFTGQQVSKQFIITINTLNEWTGWNGIQHF